MEPMIQSTDPLADLIANWGIPLLTIGGILFLVILAIVANRSPKKSKGDEDA